MSLEPRDLATDVERDQAIAALRHHTAAGLLSLDDFAEGVERVLLAETRADLVPITANLPAIPEPSAPPRELPRRWAVGVLSGERVRGPWRLDDHLHAVACLGSVEVDLCDALVVGDEATIYVVAIFGGVEVQVPEGIPVELSGFAVMGSKQHKVRRADVIPGMPRVTGARVRAVRWRHGADSQASQGTARPAQARVTVAAVVLAAGGARDTSPTTTSCSPTCAADQSWRGRSSTL